MGGINVQRWLIGGAVAGIIIWILEGLGSFFYMDAMQHALEAAGLSMDLSPGFFIITVLVSLITGLFLVFLYALARSRFGPGPRTAVIVAVVAFISGYFLSLVGYHMLGLFPDTMLVHWGLIGIVEMIVATLAGAAIYKED